MRQTFTNALGSSPYTEEEVKEAIATLNSKRKERLLLVLDYIEDQGEYCVKEKYKIWCSYECLLLLTSGERTPM